MISKLEKLKIENAKLKADKSDLNQRLNQAIVGNNLKRSITAWQTRQDSHRAEMNGHHQRLLTEGGPGVHWDPAD